MTIEKFNREKAHNINNPLPLPSSEKLNTILSYDPTTGKLFWKERTVEWFSHAKNPEAYTQIWNKVHAGKEAFCTPVMGGYLAGFLGKKRYKAHRIIWKMVHGFDPVEIDHINHKTDDNRIANLRATDRSGNSTNSKARTGSVTGHVGVYFNKEKNKWYSKVTKKGRDIFLGYHLSIESAINARKLAETQHGYLTALEQSKNGEK